MKNESHPTIKTVAKEAQVSIATVSRVLNSNQNVNSELHEKVWKAVKKLGYKPNIAARSMKGQKSGIIGFLVPNITMTYFNDMVAGAIAAAHKYNYNILVSSSNGSLEEQQKGLDSFSTSVIDGLIFSPISQISDYPDLQSFSSIPVMIAYRNNIYNNLPHLSADNIKGGYIATKYLLNIGRRKIAFLAGFYEENIRVEEMFHLIETNKTGIYSSIDRLKGYLKAHKEAGLEVDPNLIIPSGNSYENGYNSAQKMLYSASSVDALLAFNDSMAAGAINFLKEQNISVPEEISVIGYDDGPLAQIISPALTSVNQNANRIGATAVEMMMDLLEGKKVDDKILDVFLNIRQSTAKPISKINTQQES